MESTNQNIYLDNQATTCVDDRVLSAMLPYLTNIYGNPSSDNLMGVKAKTAISKSKKQVATLINASANEVYFTSGATESINWAFRGIVEKSLQTKKHIVTTSIEHSAVLKTCEFLSKKFECELTIVQPSSDGIIDCKEIQAAITENTIIVAVQHANNEIGTVQPVKEIGKICRELGIVFIVDAAQTVGKIPVDVVEMHIDILAASGHKIYAPKGIGLLYINELTKSKINPLIYGGGQEDGFRSGTQNVSFIVGLGEACKICSEDIMLESERIREMRDNFISILMSNFPYLEINGCIKNRLPGNINFSIQGIANTVIIKNLGNISISKGSACSTNSTLKSHVLMSITKNESRINSALRIGIGRFNKMEDITYAAQKMSNIINQILIANDQF